MSVSQLSVEFGEFLRDSNLEQPDAFREFAAANNLTLHDVCVLVMERPGLGRMRFLEVAEVILQQIHSGKPEIYTEFYSRLKWVIYATKATNTQVKSFADVYRMACIKAKSEAVEKIPQYQTAYYHTRKAIPEYFRSKQ